jgi:hypothetical protein
MLRIVRFGDIQQDSAGLEDADRMTGRGFSVGVGDGGDAAVGVDFEEPRFFLRVGGQLEGVNFVGLNHKVSGVSNVALPERGGEA